MPIAIINWYGNIIATVKNYKRLKAYVKPFSRDRGLSKIEITELPENKGLLRLEFTNQSHCEVLFDNFEDLKKFYMSWYSVHSVQLYLNGERRSRLECQNRKTFNLPKPKPKYNAMAPEQIKEIRTGLGASREMFAQILGVSPKMVLNWENGKKPSKMACRFLEEIKANPEYWLKKFKGLTFSKPSL